jgi:hypothetical protein
METKYIVNNLSGQTIYGNIVVTGTSTSNNYATYKALLTQTGSISGTSINDFYRALIIGETYTITNYVSGDDFSNVANVTTGTINQTGCVFIATGTTPSSWFNGSQLTSLGNLIVDVLENTLGDQYLWGENLNGQDGVYYFTNDFGGFLYNTFPRETTIVNAQVTTPTFPPPPVQIFTQPGSYTALNDVIILYVNDFDLGSGTNNKLFFTPVEIYVKQNPDTTPIILSGDVISSYPFGNISVELLCDGAFIETFYGNYSLVSNLTELVNALNNDPITNYLGTYSSDDNGYIFLTMPTNLKEQFCATGTLTFSRIMDVNEYVRALFQ